MILSNKTKIIFLKAGYLFWLATRQMAKLLLRLQLLFRKIPPWPFQVRNARPRGWKTFSVKDQMVNILGLVGCKVSVAAAEGHSEGLWQRRSKTIHKHGLIWAILGSPWARPSEGLGWGRHAADRRALQVGGAGSRETPVGPAGVRGAQAWEAGEKPGAGRAVVRLRKPAESSSLWGVGGWGMWSRLKLL